MWQFVFFHFFPFYGLHLEYKETVLCDSESVVYFLSLMYMFEGKEDLAPFVPAKFLHVTKMSGMSETESLHLRK